ncbi:hypothetical protein [Desulfobacca acetoxidans]
MRTWKQWKGAALLTALLLAVPVGVQAAADFTLGGFIALYGIWDSTQMNSNLSQLVARNNDPNNQHGRLRFSAERIRMNFTIKGPQLWGAKTTGFIEWDFDGGGNEYIMTGTPGGGWASPHKARPRLRHAMFRLNWPETELMLGQYWSLLSDDPPEVAKPGTAGIPGIIWFREPQICVKQKFMGIFEVAASIANPGNGPDGIQLASDQWTANNAYPGESSETPRFTGRVKYEQDLYGKAPFYGRPRGVSAFVAAAWQRLRYRPFVGALVGTTDNRGVMFGQNNFNTVNVEQRDQQYLNHWVVNSSLFLPIITTTTQNLAGTMSLLTHWYVGAGLDLEKEGVPNNTSYMNFVTFDAVNNRWVGDRQLAQQFGGFVQLQYYFTNQWYTTVLWGMNKIFNIDRDRWIGTSRQADPPKLNQHYYLTLWYQPIKALKFGAEYTYARTDYYQNRLQGSNLDNYGENHRLLFVGTFFF